MDNNEAIKANQKKAQEIKDLHLSVFDNEDGHKLLQFYAKKVGLTEFKPCQNDEDRIRQEAQRQFMFSILNQISTYEVPAFLYSETIQNFEELNERKRQQTSRYS